MKLFNLHKAKVYLSDLVEMAVKGEPFIITKSGKPLVKVVALDEPNPAPIKRIGFMSSEIAVPDDFDQMGEIEDFSL